MYFIIITFLFLKELQTYNDLDVLKEKAEDRRFVSDGIIYFFLYLEFRCII